MGGKGVQYACEVWSGVEKGALWVGRVGTGERLWDEGSGSVIAKIRQRAFHKPAQHMLHSIAHAHLRIRRRLPTRARYGRVVFIHHNVHTHAFVDADEGGPGGPRWVRNEVGHVTGARARLPAATRCCRCDGVQTKA